jgi:hypothetical protein
LEVHRRHRTRCASLEKKDETMRKKTPLEILRKARHKPAKHAPIYYTIGVRFVFGSNPHKTYTYRVRSRSKIHLGQELIADSMNGTSVVVVVRIDKVRQDTDPTIEYQYIERKVAPL